MPVRTRVKPLDPAAWAKSTPRRMGGTRCTVCAVPDAVEAIKAWLPLWKSGEITVSLSQACDYLNEHTPWDGKVGSLRRCLADHHGYRPRG